MPEEGVSVSYAIIFRHHVGTNDSNLVNGFLASKD